MENEENNAFLDEITIFLDTGPITFKIKKIYSLEIFFDGVCHLEYRGNGETLTYNIAGGDAKKIISIILDSALKEAKEF